LGLREVLGAEAAKEGEGGGHFVHAVHAVFEADPAGVFVGGEDAEDFVIVVEALAGDAVAEVGGVAEGAVGLAEIFESGAGDEVAIRGVHGDDAGGDAFEEGDGIVAGDEGVGGIVLDAEVGGFRDEVEEFEEDVLLLGEFGIAPEAVFVVVFEAEDDVVFAGEGEEGLDAFDDPGEALFAADFGIALAAEDAADGAGAAEATRDEDHGGFPVDGAAAGGGVGVSKVRGAAEHRHVEAGGGDSFADGVEIGGVEGGEEAVVHLEAVGVEGAGHFDPVEDGHGAITGDGVEVTLGESGEAKRHIATMRLIMRAFLLLLGLAAVGLAQDDDIVWLDNYAEAVKTAKATGKPIFLEFRCEP
jgi:hypothetical protein